MVYMNARRRSGRVQRQLSPTVGKWHQRATKLAIHATKMETACDLGCTTGA
jgi:hypothetical protein